MGLRGKRIENEEELKKRAVELRSAGVSFEQIGSELGVCRDTIRKWTRHLYPKKEAISEETAQTIVRMYKDGWKVQEIAEKFNIKSVSTIYYICRKDCWDSQRSAVPRGWVLNHPFQFELQDEERKRYLEVVERRRLTHPKSGYDYLNRTLET